jgi:hypothetical protein
VTLMEGLDVYKQPTLPLLFVSNNGQWSPQTPGFGGERYLASHAVCYAFAHARKAILTSLFLHFKGSCQRCEDVGFLLSGIHFRREVGIYCCQAYIT